MESPKEMISKEDFLKLSDAERNKLIVDALIENVTLKVELNNLLDLNKLLELNKLLDDIIKKK